MQKRSNTWGSTLLTVTFMIIILLMVAGAIGTMARSTVDSVNKSYWQSRAKYASKAGMQHALSLLRDNPNYSTDIPRTAMAGDPDLFYEVTIYNRVNETTGAYGPDNKTWVPPGTCFIYAIGQVRERANSGSAGFAALVGPQRPTFDDAAFATNTIRIMNGQVLESDPNGDTPGDINAALSTNNVAAGCISVTGGAEVFGDLRTGIGSNPASAIVVTGSTVHGAQEVREETKVITPFSPPRGLVPPVGSPPPPDVILGSLNAPIDPPSPAGTPAYLQPGTYGDVYIQEGAHLQLVPSGTGSEQQTYYITGDLVMQNGILSIPSNTDNPVKIYVDGDVFMVDSQVNRNYSGGLEEPVMLQIYQTGKNGNLFKMQATNGPPARSCSGFFLFAGADSDVQILNRVSLTGAIIAKDILVDAGSVLRYDVRLRGVSCPSVL